MLGTYAHANSKLLHDANSLGLHGVACHFATDHIVVAAALFGVKVYVLQVVVDDNNGIVVDLQIVSH